MGERGGLTFAALILGTAGTTPRGCGRVEGRGRWVGGVGGSPIIHCVCVGDHMFRCETSRVSCGSEVEEKLDEQLQRKFLRSCETQMRKTPHLNEGTPTDLRLSGRRSKQTGNIKLRAQSERVLHWSVQLLPLNDRWG